MTRIFRRSRHDGEYHPFPSLEGDQGAPDVLLRCFAEAVGADAGLVTLWGQDGAAAGTVAEWNLDHFGSPDLDQAKRFLEGTDQAAFGPAMAWAGLPDGRVNGPRITHLSGAPLETPEGVEGALLAGFVRVPEMPKEMLMWVTRSYAAATGLCLDGAGGLDNLLKAARHDGLTGCLNYRGLMEALADETGRCQRHGSELSICFFDLDGFKGVNIRGGHLHGNQVLGSFGSGIRAGIRASDSVGRFGGDEFIMLLPDTDGAATQVIVDRIGAGALDTVKRETGETLTVSTGVASWSPGVSARELLVAADGALHTAKSGGPVVPAV